VERKKAESDRVMPVRKRTALVDQRISRSRLSTETDPRELLEQQRVLQNPPRAISPSPTMSRKSLAAALGLGMPIRKEPEPEREKEEVEENSIMVVPPTPQPPVESDGRVPDPPIASLPLDDSITSPTASIVESMEKLNQPGDADSPIASGASALKRATSGEVTRMRGPKGESCFDYRIM